MMRKFLSRYRPRYIRSLVYMLQASEYDIGEYLRWRRRATDMRHIERRKTLVRTPKALVLLAAGRGILLILIVSGIVFLLRDPSVLRFVAVVIWIFAIPYMLAYLMIIPVWVIRLAQKPIEYALVSRAKKKLRNHTAFKIAIAGSFGKTSMREILKTVLAEGKKVAAPPHSHNTPVAIANFIGGLKRDEDVLIFEIGEYYPGDVRKLCDVIRPDLGIITGVNEAHLQKFKTLERTTRTIFELSDFLGAKPIYVNGENEIARLRALPEHIVYTREGAGKKKIRQPHTDLEGTTFVLSGNGEDLHITSSLLGLHHIGALAAAADIAERLGLSADAIERGLDNTKAFDYRLEPNVDSAGVITLDDCYNGNPDGVRAVIAFLGGLKNHRRFYVTPGLVEMGSRTQEVHEEIGRTLASAGIEHIILIKNSVTPFIDKGLKEAGYKGETLWFDDGLTALGALPHLTIAGDVVLLQNDWPDQYA